MFPFVNETVLKVVQKISRTQLWQQTVLPFSYQTSINLLDVLSVISHISWQEGKCQTAWPCMYHTLVPSKLDYACREIPISLSRTLHLRWYHSHQFFSMFIHSCLTFSFPSFKSRINCARKTCLFTFSRCSLGKVFLCWKLIYVDQKYPEIIADQSAHLPINTPLESLSVAVI